jgi:hypothetical protein
MRVLLAVSIMLAATFAWPQAQPGTGKAPAPEASCDECGVVTSVRSITRDSAPSESREAKPSGLVASIPLGGGTPQVGSSTRIGRDVPTISVSWEVIVKLDDGRYRVLVLDSQPDVAKGDKVRVDEGKLVPR